MTIPFVPQNPEDFSPDWVSSILDEMRLGGPPVSAVQAALIGEGTGFLGRSIRLTLGYEGSAGERPRSLVAKIPTLSPAMKAFGLQSRAYEVECRFYERLSSEVPVHAPHLYWHHADVDEGVFCLLLEDLAGYTLGNQIAAEVDEKLISELVRGAARMHARWWNDESLGSEQWLPGAAGAEFFAMHERAMAGAEPWRDEVATEHRIEFKDRVIAAMHRLPELTEQAAERASTLVHGDYRLDNVMLASEAGKPSPVVIDWQLIHRGSGAFDVAYLLSQSVPTFQRRDNESRWIDEYLTTLDRADYGEEAFRQDLAVGLLRSMAVPLMASGIVPQTRRLLATATDPDLKGQLAARLEAAQQLVQAISERGMAAIEDHHALELFA